MELEEPMLVVFAAEIVVGMSFASYEDLGTKTEPGTHITAELWSGCSNAKLELPLLLVWSAVNSVH